MRLLLRCDAGPSTGVGHAVRCAAVAEAALDAGHEVFWSGRLTGLEWLWNGLRDHPPTGPPGTLLAPADDAAALADLARLVRADAVHADHYLLGPDLRAELNAAGIVLCSVEDFHTGRRAADVVVDPNLGAGDRPRPDDGSPVLLRGPDYAPLRSSARAARAARADRERGGAAGGPDAGPPGHPAPAVPGRPDAGRRGDPAPARPGAAGAAAPPRVLVVMGGTDAAGLLPAVVGVVAAAGVPADVDVVVPAGRALDLPASGPARFRAVAPLPDLPGAAAGADLVVSAAGTTVWELCCVGVPMMLVRAADNQAEGFAAVTGAGAAAGLDPADPGAPAAVRTLLTDPATRSAAAARARDVVDGRGAPRVVAAIDRAVGDRRDARTGSTGAPDPHIPAITTRPATEDDSELLLAWRNDAGTRRWSRSREPVRVDEHRAWLRGSLDRPDRLLLVAADRWPVGTVRWDRDGDGWEVSITVAPERRGRGLAGPLLAAGERALRELVGPTAVTAVVRRANTASARLFAAAGYRPGDPDADGWVRYRKAAV